MLHSYDRNKYESMARVVDAYNTSVRKKHLRGTNTIEHLLLSGEGFA